MATFDPYSEQVMGLREQQALAQKLRDSGLEAPQGQTVSGIYVAPHPTQYLAQALKSYLGGQDVANAQQGIKDLMAQREAQNQSFLSSMPKATETQVEVRTPETMNQMGPSPLSKALRVNPTTEDMLSWASKAPGLDTAAVAQLGVKGAELQAARDARIAEARIKADTDLQRERERAQDRQDLARLTSSLKPAPQEKPLTEFQGKSVMFGTRAAAANNVLNDINANYDPLAVAASNKGGALVNWAISPENQKAAQAQTDFLTAVLRQESGATIGQGEFDTARKQYFPQPGDSEETIAQKRANRELVIKGFARQAGSGARDIAEVYDAGTPKLPQAANAPAMPNVPAIPSQNAIAAEMARRAAAATQGRP
jgi:hypothetical protein